MKKLMLLTIVFACFVIIGYAQTVITKPAFEVKNSGITNISKIELKENETRVHVHCTFIPNWWTKFEKTFIQESGTENRIYATGMEGGEFDKEIYMPASGDSTFVLIFPKLNKLIKKIDYGDGGKLEVFGISLDPNKKADVDKKVIPSGVQNWIDSELAKAKKKTLVDLKSKDFFSKEPARLIGYIKGYDPRLGFSTGMIYSGSVITREDYPAVIEVHEDGRFEATIPMNHPEYTYLSFDRNLVNYYMEPGHTLAVILDWDDFLAADRYRNIRYKFKDLEYQGPLAQVNEELAYVSSTLELPPYMNVYKDEAKKMTPEAYKAHQEEFSRKYREELGNLLGNKESAQLSKRDNLLSQTKAILNANSQVEYASYLMEFEMDYKYRKYQDASLPPLSTDFYDFLQDLPLDDQRLLLASSFSMFINRVEYMGAFDGARRAYDQPQPEKKSKEYLFEELGLKMTDEDRDYFRCQDSIPAIYSNKEITEDERNKFLADFREKADAFGERYKQQLDGYTKKYIDVLKRKTDDEVLSEEWRLKDSIYTNELKLQQGIVNDVIKVRSLDYTFGNRIKEKDKARTFLTSFDKGISNQFLKDEAERLFNKNFPSGGIAAYDLPEGKATDVFRKIIDPLKGKMLFVDFWGIFCGPCIQGIKERKETREKYKNNPDFEFVFITSNEESPLDRYNTFVEEQNLQYTHRLSADDFKYLRQLFKFNGIPRYVLINKDGRVLNDDFSMYNFENELPKLLKKEDSGNETDLSET